MFEEIDAITNASEHILFAKNMIHKHSVSSQRKQNLFEQLQYIEKRTTDATLYLAVLGEFSSGKSTFINALLRQRLLKSARVATTASATYIKYGHIKSVSVTFSNQKCIRATESNYSQLCKTISELKTDLPKKPSLNQLIDLLTSDQAVANWVKRIDIWLPEERLKSGLSIIDTPGIGAGVDYTHNHASVTQTVIKESADAAIVLIPSSAPMSDTLISFLRTTASHFLHRCVFVVTAMDDREEEEREQIINFVKGKLKEKLGLVNPMVLESAAITMLPIAKIPSYKQDIWSYWQRQFIGLETIFLREMIRQRNVIISERLVCLLQAIFLELNQDIEDKQKKLALEEQYLNANSVTAIEEVLKKLFEQCIEKISRQGNICKSNLSSKKNKFSSDIKAEVSNIINENGWDIIHNYDNAVEPKIREAVEAEGQKFVRKVNKDIKKLQKCCEEVSYEFREQFEKNYQNLKALGVNIAIPSLTVSSVSITSISFTSPKFFIEQVNEEDNKRAGWGAAIGAAAGFIFLGPIGAAAGAAAGGFTGYRSGNDLDSCRQEVRNKVGNDVDEYVDKYFVKVQSTIDNFVNDAVSYLQSIVEAHLSEYGAVVNKMVTEHHQKRNQLNRDIQEINSDSTELSRRKQILETLKSKLIQV
ncbi:MAG: dynamin family protein [Rivularia sp. (in: cyanobacteria)]